MKSEFALAFNQICAEYGLPREVVIEAVRAALAKAFERDSHMAGMQNVTADIDLETGTARIYMDRMVVEEVSDPQTEISLEEARRHKPDAQIGDIIRIDVTPRDFGRIAAQTAKQVITQRLREAERESQFNRFSFTSFNLIKFSLSLNIYNLYPTLFNSSLNDFSINKAFLPSLNNHFFVNRFGYENCLK